MGTLALLTLSAAAGTAWSQTETVTPDPTGPEPPIPELPPSEPPAAELPTAEPASPDPANPDPASPDPAAVAAECLAELDRIHEAMAEEDTGRAMVLLDMAQEPCASARRALTEAIGEGPESSPIVLSTLWQMELRRVELITEMGECDDARRALQEVAGSAGLPASVESDFARVAHAALACGPRPGASTGGTFSISPGFTDITQSGTTVGEQDASGLSDYCWGWIPVSPNYTMEVTEDMTLSLSAYSYSGADLVLYVTGPSGTFCNDDYDGLNPAVSEHFIAGTYDVYVGEYSSSGYGSDYTLMVSGSPLYATTTTYPTYGEVWLGPGYGRTTLSGSVWGYLEASASFGEDCEGWIAETPDFRLYVEGTGETWVNVTGSGGSDLTLVVDGPGGRYCRDDETGNDPALHETLTPGTYNVWVGDHAGASTGVSYGIVFSAYDPMAALETEPSYGEASVGPGDAPVTLTGSVEGTVPASDFFGSSCYGSIGTAPSHRLTVTADAMVEVVARSTDYGDLVIALSGPSGTFCNDDYDGLDPGVRRWLTAGDYLVYVGQLSATPGVAASFTTTITTSAGTPPPDLTALTTGLFGTVSVGYAFGSTTLSGTSGGPNSAEDLDSSCRGWITEQPSFLMDVVDYSYVTLNVLAEGDTTLVLMGPDGIICNDDFSGLNPGIQQYLSPGRWGVWVGSYSSETDLPFMINFSPDTSW